MKAQGNGLFHFTTFCIFKKCELKFAFVSEANRKHELEFVFFIFSTAF